MLKATRRHSKVQEGSRRYRQVQTRKGGLTVSLVCSSYLYLFIIFLLFLCLPIRSYVFFLLIFLFLFFFYTDFVCLSSLSSYFYWFVFFFSLSSFPCSIDITFTFLSFSFNSLLLYKFIMILLLLSFHCYSFILFVSLFVHRSYFFLSFLTLFLSLSFSSYLRSLSSVLTYQFISLFLYFPCSLFFFLYAFLQALFCLFTLMCQFLFSSTLLHPTQSPPCLCLSLSLLPPSLSLS